MEKGSGSTEELVNDGQSCAVSEDTGITDNVSQGNETKSEAKRYVGLQHCSCCCHSVSCLILSNKDRFNLKCGGCSAKLV